MPMAKRTNRVAWGLVWVLAVVVMGGIGALVFQLNSWNRQQDALADAVWHGDVGALRVLFDRGVTIAAPIPGGYTYLDTAVRFYQSREADLRHAELVRLLLAHGANARAQNAETGETALQTAVLGAHIATVQILLDAGADPNACPKQSGMTALMAAVRLHPGQSANEQTALVWSMLAHGAGVNMRSRDGMTVLMHAASGGNPAVVKLLLAHGAAVEATLHEHGRAYTAVDFARAHRNVAVVQMLRQAGAKG